MTTLKQNYSKRKIASLQQHTKLIDQQLLKEAKVSRLIIEAMDGNDLKKAENVISKLNSLKKAMPDAKAFQDAIAKAINDVNKYTGGGSLQKMGSDLLGKLTGDDNPIVKALAFSSCIEKAFAVIPTILKNHGIDSKSEGNITDIIQGIKKDVVKKEGFRYSNNKINEAPKDEAPKDKGTKETAAAGGDKKASSNPVTAPAAKAANDTSKPSPDAPKPVVAPEQSPVPPAENGSNQQTDKLNSTQKASQTISPGKETADAKKDDNGGVPTPTKPPADSAKDIESVKANIHKSLIPAGIFGVFKNTPYVSSIDALVSDIMSIDIKQLNDGFKVVNSGDSSDDVSKSITGAAAEAEQKSPDKSGKDTIKISKEWADISRNISKELNVAGNKQAETLVANVISQLIKLKKLQLAPHQFFV